MRMSSTKLGKGDHEHHDDGDDRQRQGEHAEGRRFG